MNLVPCRANVYRFLEWKGVGGQAWWDPRPPECHLLVFLSPQLLSFRQTFTQQGRLQTHLPLGLLESRTAVLSRLFRRDSQEGFRLAILRHVPVPNPLTEPVNPPAIRCECARG